MAQKPDPLLAKLDELDRLYARGCEQMNDPAVAKDPQRIVALSKEHARLGRIVEPYRLYLRLAEQVCQAQAIIADPASDGDFKALAQAELDEAGPTADNALDYVRGLLVMGEDEEIDSVVLEIRAGTGGDEAALFAGDLLNMYRHYAEDRRWKFELLSASPTEMGGYREVIASVKGEGVWSRLGYEGGGHRVQRVPKTESQGRIHTSAATVAVLPEPKNIQVNIDWDKDVLEYTSRASGPGGQNVNKVESAIKLEHVETGITVSMRDEKSQHKNRAKARLIMAARVYEYHRSRQAAVEAEARKSMIGSGDRSQRIRTYNYPQNRCTDHRLKQETSEGANFNLQQILAGNLDEMIDSMVAYDKAQRLANL